MASDRVAGVLVALFGLTLAAFSASIAILPEEPSLSARFFPYLLSGVLTMAGLALLLRPGQRRIQETLRALTAKRSVRFALLFIIYATAFRYVDFRLSTWAFTLAAMLILGARSRIELVVLPFAVATVTYYVFRHGFTVLLPSWT